MTGLGEALSSLRKWYTIHVHRKVYIVVVGCISFRREDSVNETHTHTHTVEQYSNTVAFDPNDVLHLLHRSAYRESRNLRHLSRGIENEAYSAAALT